jgi:peptidyl-prolyl cis-trans isomerase B (cyclophilin B)
MIGTVGKPLTCLFFCTGDVMVSHRWKPIVACLSLVLFATVGGCGHSGDGDKSPTAALDGTDKEDPSSGGSQSPGNPKPNANSQLPVVLIDTTLGKITVELNRKKAPLTVDNFLTYVNESFYDQSIIHQVSKGQAILGGGYGKNMLPIAKTIHVGVRNEADNGLSNTQGTIAMVRLPGDVHGATSQFFINVANNSKLLDYKDRSTPEGYGYCVFGKVIEGMDVLDKINALPLQDTLIEQTPTEQVVVRSIRRIR